MAEAEYAQNNLFWWSRKISRPWLLPTEKEGCDVPKDEDTENGADFLGRGTTAEGTNQTTDTSYPAIWHRQMTTGQRSSSTVPCMNKFF